MKQGIDYIWVGCWALITNDNHQVLLMKRTNKSQWWDGWYRSQPWWAIDFGEKIQEAIKREIKEELNIDIELFWDMLFMEYIDNKDGNIKHWVTWWYLAKIKSWEIKTMEPEKHSDTKWFDLDALPENITEYTKPFIEKYKERINHN